MPKDTPTCELKEQVIEPQTFSGGMACAKLDIPTQILAFNSGLRPIMKTMSLFIHFDFIFKVQIQSGALSVWSLHVLHVSVLM